LHFTRNSSDIVNDFHGHNEHSMLDIHFQSFPMIESDRLILREITPEDAGTLFALRSHPDVARYLDRDNDRDVAAVVELIQSMDNAFASGDGVQWGITQRHSNNLIGVVCLWRFDKTNHRAEVGYMLHPHAWRQGIMTEAVRAVLDYAFRELKLHSVEANTSVANLASHALLLKCGFVQEAHFRENWYYNGVFHDSLIFCKLTDIR
jgi:ribosomal-protein-alanine N-acetyltransferase